MCGTPQMCDRSPGLCNPPICAMPPDVAPPDVAPPDVQGPDPASASDTTGIPGAGDIWVALFGAGWHKGPILGCIPSKAKPPTPIWGCAPPGSARGTAERGASAPSPGRAKALAPLRPSSSRSPHWASWDRHRPQILPKSHFCCFSPQFPARGNNSLRGPDPAGSPSPFPRLGKCPGDTRGPIGKGQGGTRSLLETQKSFPISGFETPSIKMCKICELTPKLSCSGQGTGLELHPLFCSRGQPWGHHPVPTGDTRSRPTPETTRGILGGRQRQQSWNCR